MNKKLSDIAKIVDGKVSGNASVVITGLSGIKEAKSGDLTFLANVKYFPLLEKTAASAVIVASGVETGKIPALIVDNPSLAFSKIAEDFFQGQASTLKGIHSSAIIGQNVSLGKNVAIGAYAIIEDGVTLGDNTCIYGLSFIGHHTKIGADCLIYPNVTIREKINIGQRVIIHSGTVIGCDGFGFANVKGVNVKIPQIGTVDIGDDVEIGANVSIDRARFDKTVIGEGTKIDNLVQIAHNVRIGKNCIIVSQAGISGSTILEDNVTLAGQAGLVGHITIGKNSIVAAKSGVPNSIPPDSVYWGFPAKPIDEAKKVNAAVQRLPHYVKIILDLKKRVDELENQNK
ncbi:MAG: UDP-3-O-(3-hydroxymyristoyl)glucosamine N-acyltransferase [Candidatus Omnitrophica bacterium]|nr:UDP-3-O-(3-hydroxymyristoyl)glucosamine N-acyltransferase [Candidatus Omnitrophota bacterium]